MKPLHFLFTILIAIGLSVGLTRYFTPEKIVYATEYQQSQIDSLSVEIRNALITNRALRDSLHQTTKAFQERISRRDEEIASYARITGRLRMERDSLEEISVALPELSQSEGYRDTVLTAQSVYGDSLMVAYASAGIRADSLFLEAPQVEMLRPIRLDVAVTLTSDRVVHTLVTSRDLEDIRVEAYTTLQPPKRFPWFWVGVAAGAVGISLLQ